MKERILEFLRKENKSSAQLAEEIGVQASGISHILSGRNNPSLDFVLKMIEKYQFLSTDWLLFGKGSMYKDARMQDLFSAGNELSILNHSVNPENETINHETEFNNITKRKSPEEKISSDKNDSPLTVKIVWFYEDNTFEEYFPRR
jgi:transcriptional regulator with XRE-family HTH domain